MQTKQAKNYLSKKDIEKLQNLSFDEASELMDKLPLKLRLKMYAQDCTIGELKDLINGYKEKGLDDRLKLLKKYCQKQRRPIVF